jgi:hypothetical protein
MTYIQNMMRMIVKRIIYHLTSPDDLVNYIGQNKIAGDNIILAIYRNGHVIDLKATLTARPSLLPFLTTRSALLSFAIPHPHEPTKSA